MKTLKLMLSLAGLLTLLLCSNCKSDDVSMTDQQEAAKLLNGTWGNAQVLSSPVAGATGTLTNLVLTFDISDDLQPSTFVASGAPEYFPSETTWSWASAAEASEILLDGSLPVTAITLDALTATNMTISFSLNGPVGGRVNGIGEYTLSFTKQ
ncbi:MAG: hypothetical protein AB7O48_03370 [Cyclobacteriaceae bacterium]